MSWNLSLQLNNLYAAVRALQQTAISNPVAANFRINAATATTNFGIEDCNFITAGRTSTTLILANYAGTPAMTVNANTTCTFASDVTVNGTLTATTANSTTANTTTQYLTTLGSSVSGGASINLTAPTTSTADLWLGVFDFGLFVSMKVTSPVSILIALKVAALPNGFLANGQSITVLGVGAPWNGVYTVTFGGGITTGGATYTLNNPNGITTGTTTTALGTVSYLNTTSNTTIGSISTAGLTINNLNGKLGVVGASTASGNVVLCNNTTNTSGNFDLQTDSDQHLTFSGGSGVGANVLSVGGGTYGAISIPSTLGSLTVNTARLSTGAGNLGGNIVLGSSTSGNNLTGAGINNTIVGSNAGNALTTGTVNTLIGEVAGRLMTTGASNVAVGAGAMAIGAVTGGNNVAVGVNAGNAITTGSINTYVGVNAGVTSVEASGNVGIGAGALANASGSTANNNTAIGRDALSGVMTTGTQNIGIGFNTGVVTTGNNNTLIGQAVARSLTTGSGNICIGYDVGNTAPLLTTGNFNLYIGYGANASNGAVSGEIVLGQGQGKGINTFFVASTGGSQQGNGSASWGIPCDIRIKTNIVPLENALSKILALEIISYEHKEDIHNNLVKKRSGYIAQEYEKLFPEHCGTCVPNRFERDELGLEEVKTLTPELMPHMIKAFQEQHAEITDLKAQLASLKAVVDALVAQKDLLVV